MQAESRLGCCGLFLADFAEGHGRQLCCKARTYSPLFPVWIATGSPLRPKAFLGLCQRARVFRDKGCEFRWIAGFGIGTFLSAIGCLNNAHRGDLQLVKRTNNPSLKQTCWLACGAVALPLLLRRFRCLCS